MYFSPYSRIFLWQTCNALFILRVILSHWICLEKEAVLIKKFSFQQEDSCESLLENLAVQLVEILVDVPLRLAKEKKKRFDNVVNLFSFQGRDSSFT